MQVYYNDFGQIPHGYSLAYAEAEGKDGVMLTADATGEASLAIPMLVPQGSFIVTPEQQCISAERKKRVPNSENHAVGFRFIAADHDFSVLKSKSLARLAYLSTYLKFNSDALYKTQRTPIGVNDLTEILNLSSASVSRFMQEICPDYITVDDREALHLNSDIFRFGKLDESRKRRPFRRINITAVRYLYTRNGDEAVTYLGQLLKALPCVNIYCNLFCRDIYEPDIDKADPLSLPELCDLLERSRTTISRVVRALSDTRLVFGARSERLCVIERVGGRDMIFLNPHIINGEASMIGQTLMNKFELPA